MSPRDRLVDGDASEPDRACLPQLARVAAAAVLGGGPPGAGSLDACLDEAIVSGVPLPALREALLLLAPFAGFPRALDALAAFRDACARADVVASAAPEDGDDADFRVRGRAFFDRVYGASADRVLERIRLLDPDVPAWVLESAYGRVLSRPGLTAATRECLAVVLLAALRLPNQLGGHVRGALACGATENDVRAALDAAADLLPADLVAVVLASLQDDDEQPR